MLLDSTTKKIQLVLTAAKTTNDMPVCVYYVDTNPLDLPVAGIAPTNSNGITVVDILAAPAASTQRKVNAITVNNADTAAKTVKIYLDDNGIDYLLCAATLQVGDVLGYIDTAGWYAQDSDGARKTIVDLTYAKVVAALGFTPEDVANKDIDGTLVANSDTKYPSQKAVKTYVDNKQVAATNVEVTQRTIGNSANLDVALGNLDDSQASQKDSGFESWTGAGNYYSIATNQLTLLRGGVGYIKGKKVSWSAPQTTGTLTSHAAHWIYIDINGTIGSSSSRTETLYQDNIILFEAHHDGTDIEVVVENHAVSFDTGSSHAFHELFGTVLTPVTGTNVIGADITRVATGTGGVAGDRQIKIVGTANVNDQGLSTNIPDSAGAAVSWKIYYKDTSGFWVEYATQTQLPMFYNNAGTPTALATSGSTDVGVFVAYAIKAEPNSGLPIYILVMNDAVFGTDAAAITSISNGDIEIADGTLFQALEPCRLGYAVVTNNVSGGYISTLQISKQVGAASAGGGAGASAASSIPTNTADFKGTLSVTDSNVQTALNTVDKIERISADLVAAGTTDLSTMTGNFGRITGNTGITDFGVHAAGHLVHLVFTGAPLITHSATLDIPGGANLQIAAGDRMILRALGDGTFAAGTSGNYWQIITHIPSSVTGTGSTVKNTAPTLTNPILNAGSGTLVLPQSASPAQTAEGSMVWDTDDNLLTVGDGASRKTMVDTGSTQSITGVKTLTGALAAATLADNTNTLALADAQFVQSQIAYKTASKAHAQAIAMTAAASGSNGIAAADDADLDMGTGNFTLHFEGFLPDYTPSANVVVAQKSDGTNGGVLTWLTTGYLRLTINTTNYDSTAVLSVTDGAPVKITAPVTRESASAAGSVAFYNYGIQIGASVAITAGAPVSVDNASSLYVLGTSSTRTEGSASSLKLYNRAMTAAEVRDLCLNGVAEVDKYGNQTVATPTNGDFSDATYTDTTVHELNGWNNQGTHNAANKFTIVAGACRLISDGTAVGISGASATLLTYGKRYRIGITVSAVVSGGITLYIGTSSSLVISTTGTFYLEGVVSNVNQQYIRVYRAAGMGACDVTFDNITYQQMGAVINLEPEGIQPSPGQWLDSSSNKNHAMQPATGSSTTRRMKNVEVRGQNAWAGTHEAQYVGGVNQAVFPTNFILEYVVIRIEGANIQDFIAGDGAAGSRWIAITTGIAAGTYIFRANDPTYPLANVIGDGTNYKAVFDPDTNCTMTIHSTWVGKIYQ